ncbi:MAG: glucose-1-phosphate thymidylyltransferase [Kiritimatiellaceae bacterium]|nr:glucose-1-phosphate thymidylyltransferase [Kiritimatiellaceae bacterium]
MSGSFKGIILAGGLGTRLHPVTKCISKQLLPVYDKPMIYYPLSILMMAGIREVLIISTPTDISDYQLLLGDGKNFGIQVEYEVQEKPDGLAQAFIIGEQFIGNQNVALILGDNIFYGPELNNHLKSATANRKGATIFGCKVNDPQRFGIVQFDDLGKVISIEEKPKSPKSDYAVTGLYFYDNEVIEIAKQIQPSLRGELEITDVNNVYQNSDNLNVIVLDDTNKWLDTGTHDSLLEASCFVKKVEKESSMKVACLEEIAFSQDWISRSELVKQASSMGDTCYGNYLMKVAGQSK